MNDLTKEELIKLKNGLEHLPNTVSMSKKYWDECEEIIRKLQSMIDTYCEHKERTLDNRECMKCDAIICNECLGVIK